MGELAQYEPEGWAMPRPPGQVGGEIDVRREAAIRSTERPEAISERLPSYAAVLVGQSSLLLQGLTRVLEDTDFQVVATWGQVDGAVLPDVQRYKGVVHILQGRQIESALRQVRSFRSVNASGRIAVVLDTMRWEDTLSFFEAGAHACFPESVAPDVFVKSLELIMLGESFVSTTLPLELPARGRPAPEGTPAQLSPQEERILRNIADGDPNKVIARALGIADATVKIHVKNILRKLGVGNRTQAAMWATRHGVCAPRSRPALAAVDGKTVAPGLSLAEDHGEKTPEPQVSGSPDYPAHSRSQIPRLDEIRVERSPGPQLRIQLSERRMMEEQERREELLANARRLRELREARETEMRRSKAD